MSKYSKKFLLPGEIEIFQTKNENAELSWYFIAIQGQFL